MTWYGDFLTVCDFNAWISDLDGKSSSVFMPSMSV